MSATETLRKDHQEIKRVEKIVIKCYQALYDGKDIPLSDIEKITFLISEFLDSIHTPARRIHTFHALHHIIL